MLKPPQLIPVHVEEQQLYMELTLDDEAPHLKFKSELDHPTEDVLFSCLYPGTLSVMTNTS